MISNDVNGFAYFDNVSVKELTLDDSKGTNDGSPVGTTTNSTVYGDNAPKKPRIADSAPDSVANYGTLYSGTALSFDGTNDYVEVNDVINDISSNTSGSVSLWARTPDNTTGGHLVLFSVGDTDGNTFFMMQVRNYGELRCGIKNNNVNKWYAETSQIEIEDDKWYHIVAVQNGTSPLIYINGKSIGFDWIATTDTTQWFYDLSGIDNCTVGAHNANSDGYGSFWNGLISSPKIFDVALTEAQIQEMYLNPEQILPTGVSVSNLKLWLPFQESTGTTAYDGSGNNNDGTITGATWSTANTDIPQTALVRQNKPMVFDGTDDYVNCGTDSIFATGNNNFTMSAWVCADTFAGAYNYIMAIGNGSPGQQAGIGIDSSGSLFCSAYSTPIVTTTSTVNTGQLYHICAVYTGGATDELDFYVGGAFFENESIALNVAVGKMFIGVNVGGLSNFFGSINEVSIFDTALTSTEVSELYNSGTPLDATLHTQSANLVGYWRNDGDTSWEDRSTNSNDGTVSGSPSTIVLPEGNTSGRDSQGFFLTNTDENVLTLNGAEYVDAGDIGDVKSVGLWVKPNSQDQDILQLSDTLQIGISDNAPSDWSILRADGTMDNAVQGSVWDNSNAEQTSISDSIKLINTTLDNIGMNDTRYVNGSTASMTVPNDTWSHITITSPDTIDASNFKTSNDFDGMMDDIMVYTSELTNDQANKNYNAGKSKHS